MAAGLLVAGGVTAGAGCAGGDADTSQDTSTRNGAEAPASTRPTPARADAAAVGEKAFALWSRRDVSYATWWHDLELLLSPAGRDAYENTDPTQIPPLKITGPAALSATAPDDPNLSATVTVPTDQGQFSLFMSRPDKGGTWQLLRITFPKGLG